MTKDEARAYFIDNNERIISVAKDENIYNYETQQIEDVFMRRTFEANESAIKALEQEQCEDAISRQAVLDIVTEQEKIASDHVRDTPSSLDNGLHTWVNPAYTRYSTQLSERSQFKAMIQTMPSVNPEKPCEDAISRTEVKRIVDFYKEQIDGIYRINESIDNLSPVTPKLKHVYCTCRSLIDEIEIYRNHIEQKVRDEE